MKKLLIFVLSLLTFVSCCKKDKKFEDLTQKVIFSYKAVAEKPMTRAINNNAIIDWIGEQLPTSISLRLTDSNGNKYTVETGSEIELPLGVYTVTGKSIAPSTQNVVGSDVSFSSIQPSLNINTILEVVYSQTQYTIPANFTGFGIVIDYEETASATYQSSHGESGTIQFATIGTAGIVFVNGNLDTHSLDVTLNPVNNSDKQTTYTFKNEYLSTTISPTFGNYYIIHPKAITGIEGGLFSYTVDRFQAIDIE